MIREDIRNIAIIAHVDHGKTTLVDEMLKQGGVFRENQQVAERVMDSNDLERERGITILAKNTAVHYKGMQDQHRRHPRPRRLRRRGGARAENGRTACFCWWTAFEGPMPQTRFVLQKALELDHKVIIVINKIDRPDARCDEVVDEMLELLMELDADGRAARQPHRLLPPAATGTATTGPGASPAKTCARCLTPSSSTSPRPRATRTAPLQLLISTIDYNDYVGRIGIGRIERGTHRSGHDGHSLRLSRLEHVVLPRQRVWQPV